MRIRSFAIFIAVSIATTAFGQPPEKPLATAKGIVITASELSPEGRQLFEQLPRSISATRTRILSTYLADILLDTEAKSRKLSVARLQEEALRSVPDPNHETIQAIYDANKTSLGNKPLQEVRSQIVEFLRREPEQNALQAQVADLQKKYALKLGKDVNAVDLKPLDAVATIDARTITLQEFEETKKIELHDAKAHIFEDLRAAVEETLLSSLVTAEARSLSIEPNTLLAQEITNKMRDFTDEETNDLKYALQDRLFKKYSAKIILDEPAPLILNVSVDDDPFIGPATAPVTIVMFSDFQCPACARTHPVVKRVVNEYAGKVRLVVRDYPLESLHPEAFLAAAAANAVRQQGKYFEFIDILYRNQDNLGGESLNRFAADLGLDTKRMTTDMAAAGVAEEIRKDISDGDSYGVSGTPTIFVNGVKVYQFSAPAFRRAIERFLAR